MLNIVWTCVCRTLLSGWICCCSCCSWRLAWLPWPLPLAPICITRSCQHDVIHPWHWDDIQPWLWGFISWLGENNLLCILCSLFMLVLLLSRLLIFSWYLVVGLHRFSLFLNLFICTRPTLEINMIVLFVVYLVHYHHQALSWSLAGNGCLPTPVLPAFNTSLPPSLFRHRLRCAHFVSATFRVKFNSTLRVKSLLNSVELLQTKP